MTLQELATAQHITYQLARVREAINAGRHDEARRAAVTLTRIARA